MYHRFNENKYPSTNIRNEIFLEHLKEIKNSEIEFITFQKFEEIIKNNIKKNYILLTIDDAFESFYINAWPILKSEKIPFILFVSTREIGKHGYMTWNALQYNGCVAAAVAAGGDGTSCQTSHAAYLADDSADVFDMACLADADPSDCKGKLMYNVNAVCIPVNEVILFNCILK